MTEDSIQKYSKQITNRILTFRDKQVMLDMHLAELYGIETKFLNRAVKRNPNRFPESFMFQLSKEEYEDLRFQFGTSNESDLNQAVKRNIVRFPEMFRFQLSEEEFENWKSQIVMSNKGKMDLILRNLKLNFGWN